MVAFIGDVHGWSDRLDRVVAQIDGPIVFMGDLIDRGPDVPKVLDTVHALCDAGRAQCLLGNHEFAMIRALGSEAHGIPESRAWFERWRDRYDGDRMLAQYGVRNEAGLRKALGSHHTWIASLPWVLTDHDDATGWIAVHAGLDPAQPWRGQVDELATGWKSANDKPGQIYEKRWAFERPDDLPSGICLISGHTPLSAPLAEPKRILCDATGGYPGRQLAAVRWPELTVVRG